jgi:hypothetical protein
MPSGLKATFFCYRPFRCLTGSVHEVAVHPYLATSTDWISTTKDLISRIEDENGVAVKGLRPHSLMSSQNYLVQLDSEGIEYVSSVCASPNTDSHVFRYPWGPVEIPIRYMDNMDLWARDKAKITDECFSKSHIQNSLLSSGVYCFDFHPIHILLNTSRFDDYNQWTVSGRPEIKSCTGIDQYGVRSYFLDLCQAINGSSAHTELCIDLAKLFKSDRL